MSRGWRTVLESFSKRKNLLVFSLKRSDSKGKSSILFWTSLGNPQEWSQDSPLIIIALAITLDMVSAS